MEDNYVTPLEVIEQARQLTPIYLCGSRQMHKLSGDEESVRVTKQYATLAEGFKGMLLDKNLFGDDLPTDVLIPISDETDYDFYATYSTELETFLLDRGFDQTDFVKGMSDASGYGDLDDEAVTILERDDVQIVLRNDAEFYRAVFDNIEPSFYKNYLWKSSGQPTVIRENIQPIFNMLFDIARAAKGLK